MCLVRKRTARFLLAGACDSYVSCVHCVACVTLTARSILGWIRKQFGMLTKKEFNRTWNSSIQAWSPYLQKDINCLERIQQRATTMVHGLKDVSYEGRLETIGLCSLQNRRLRGDLIEVFKILTGREKVDKYQSSHLHHPVT